MVEDLITAFSRFRNFAVVARHSVFVYKNRQFDIRDAARALGVRYLLEGSVRRSGDRMRVTAQLIDGSSGEHLWAQKLDGTVDDLFDFQDRVTSEVVGLIEPEIRKAEIGRAQRKHPESLDAYDLYWRALPLLQASHSRGYSEAVDLLDRAVMLEPEFGPILALAAYAHDKRLGWGLTPQGADDKAAAISLADRALAADSSDPFALLVGGMVEGTKGNRAGSVAMARKAFELNPNSALICNITGYLNWTIGNYDEAIACSLRSVRLSPGAREVFWSLNNIARAHLSAGRFEESLVWGLRSIEANAELEEPRVVVIASYAQLDQMEEAGKALAALVALNPQASIADLLAGAGGPHNGYLREGLERADKALQNF